MDFLKGLPMSEKTYTVLFVDDDRDVLDMYSALLENSNYRIFRAASGTEAVTMMDQHQFDCIITDLKMPDGNGLKVRDAAMEREIPLIIVTGYQGSYKTILDAKDVVLEKPVRRQDLINTIEKIAS